MTKESRPYTVNIAPELVARLRVLKRRAKETAFGLGIAGRLDDLYIFTPNGGEAPWTPHSALRIFRLAAEAAEPDGFTLHGLRHYHATQCLRAGLSTRVVADRIGCTEANVTAAHSHRVENTIRQARRRPLRPPGRRSRAVDA